MCVLIKLYPPFIPLFLPLTFLAQTRLPNSSSLPALLPLLSLHFSLDLSLLPHVSSPCLFCFLSLVSSFSVLLSLSLSLSLSLIIIQHHHLRLAMNTHYPP